MASVTLNKLWIHDAEDLTSYVQVDIDTISPGLITSGRVVELASGRRRLVTAAGAFRNFQVRTELGHSVPRGRSGKACRIVAC